MLWFQTYAYISTRIVSHLHPLSIYICQYLVWRTELECYQRISLTRGTSLSSDRSSSYRRRLAARKRFSSLFQNSETFHVIHYSCETFKTDDGAPVSTSRRVTSIAILHVGSRQMRSFSIHLTAEKMQARRGQSRLAADAVLSDHYDSIEKEMLKEFYE